MGYDKLMDYIADSQQKCSRNNAVENDIFISLKCVAKNQLKL